jgi:hypothetical protein
VLTCSSGRPHRATSKLTVSDDSLAHEYLRAPTTCTALSAFNARGVVAIRPAKPSSRIGAGACAACVALLFGVKRTEC